jgi:hypothetical protein
MIRSAGAHLEHVTVRFAANPACLATARASLSWFGISLRDRFSSRNDHLVTCPSNRDMSRRSSQSSEREPLIFLCEANASLVFSACVECRVVRWVEVRVSRGIRGLFGSCPLRGKTLVFPWFFAFLASSFGVLVRPCETVHGACGVVFRVTHRKSSRFSSRARRQNTGVLHLPVWHRSTAVEAVGFELSSRFRRTSQHAASFPPTLGRPCAVTFTSCLFP